MTEPPKLEDLDPVETQEWLESIDSVLKTHGPERAHFLLERLIDYTRRSGAYLPFKPNRSEEHTSELQSRLHLVCRLLLEKKNIRPRLMPRRRPSSPHPSSADRTLAPSWTVASTSSVCSTADPTQPLPSLLDCTRSRLLPR